MIPICSPHDHNNGLIPVLPNFTTSPFVDAVSVLAGTDKLACQLRFQFALELRYSKIGLIISDLFEFNRYNCCVKKIRESRNLATLNSLNYSKYNNNIISKIIRNKRNMDDVPKFSYNSSRWRLGRKHARETVGDPQKAQARPRIIFQ